jgi:hypothetical protein
LRYGTGPTARQCQQQCAGIDGEEFPFEPPRKQAHPLDRPIVAKGRTIPLMVQHCQFRASRQSLTMTRCGSRACIAAAQENRSAASRYLKPAR